MNRLDAAMAFFAFLTGFAPPLSIALANGAWIGLALCAAADFALRRKTPGRLPTPVNLPLAAFLAAWLAAGLLGMDPAESLARFPKELRFAVFFLLLWAGGGRFRSVALKGYLWGAGAAAVFGLVQFGISSFGLLEPRPGWMSEKAAAYLTLRVGRVHGAVHPLTFAAVLLPAALLWTARFLDEETPRRRGLALLGAAGTGTVFLLTQSRGPWLAAALGFLTLAVLHPRRLRLLAPAAVFAALLLAHPAMRRRIATFSETRTDPSAVIRLTLWRNGLFLARKHPWTGVGPGMARAAADRHRDDPGFAPNPHGMENDLHNLFLHHMVERGVLGLAALLWLLAAPMRMAWKTFRAPPSETALPGHAALALFAFFLSFPILNFTERAFDDAEVALLYWILAAAACRLPRRDPPHDP